MIGQGLDTRRAAIAGVYVHAATGELLGAEMGDAGVLAGDVLAALPRTLKEIKS
jgi:NAD(P)H-hydrate repair Nnr-like enzyme with NAD(P)H-hydrate dehydratase domain